VPRINRHAHRCRGHPDAVIPQDLLGLVDHLHLFGRVAVVPERLALRNLWDAVERDGVRENVAHRFLARQDCPGLSVQLVNSRFPRPRHGLVGRDHHPRNRRRVMERFQHHHHLDGRTIRVGNDALVPSNIIGIHFRHDQRHLRVHPPRTRIVDDHATVFRGKRREMLARAPARAEQGDVHPFERILGQHLHRDLFALERHGLALGPLGSERLQRFHGEIAFFENKQHLPADHAGCTGYGNDLLRHVSQTPSVPACWRG